MLQPAVSLSPDLPDVQKHSISTVLHKDGLNLLIALHIANEQRSCQTHHSSVTMFCAQAVNACCLTASSKFALMLLPDKQ